MNVNDYAPWAGYRRGQVVDRQTVKAALGAAASREAEGTVTLPADLYRLLLDLAMNKAVIKNQEGRPADTTLVKLGKWIMNPNHRAARYAERLNRVWRVRYGRADFPGAVRQAVEKIGSGAVESKVHTVIHNRRHKRVNILPR